jgi:hypothetical protein
MRVKEAIINYNLNDFNLVYSDVYSNNYNKSDFSQKELCIINALEVRDININFRLKGAKLVILDLYEVLKELDDFKNKKGYYKEV